MKAVNFRYDVTHVYTIMEGAEQYKTLNYMWGYHVESMRAKVCIYER